MMTNSKWLRHVLLSGVALGVTITGAQADELSALKGQLEALQSRVNQLETMPAPAALPGDGDRLITFKRGQGTLGDWMSDGVTPSDSGYTITITPTADVAAPVTEISVSGYVKNDVIYDFDQDSIGYAFGVGVYINEDYQPSSGITLSPLQTRFRIKSKTDTTIGQIRTWIEGDFWSDEGHLRARHAWGEWDMTPNWTLGAGQTWRIGCDVFTGVTTVDFDNSAGICKSTRAPQVRLTYTSGPAALRLGIEQSFAFGDYYYDIDSDSYLSMSPDFPNLAAAVLYDVPGGHELFASATVNHIDYDINDPDNSSYGSYGVHDDDVGWDFQGGANINLADVATFTGHFGYSDGSDQVKGGYASHILVSSSVAKIKTLKAWGLVAGLSFDVNDETQLNVQYGHADPSGSEGGYTSLNTLHANILWRPVRQMRLGWEAIYGWKRNSTETIASSERKRTEDAFRGQFGAWFFF